MLLRQSLEVSRGMGSCEVDSWVSASIPRILMLGVVGELQKRSFAINVDLHMAGFSSTYVCFDVLEYRACSCVRIV